MGHSEAKYAFIVGNGRSGTHMLARLLGQIPLFDDLVGGRENGYVFKLASSILKRSELNVGDIKTLIARLRKLNSLAEAPIFLDQTHVLHWYDTYLSQELKPNYLMLLRDPIAVINSTMLHKGAKEWLRDDSANEYFLGRDLSCGDWRLLDDTSLAALRWVANIEKFAEIRTNKDARSILIQYEDFSSSCEPQMQRILEFLGYSDFEYEIDFEFRNSSLEKFTISRFKQKERILSLISSALVKAREDEELMELMRVYGVD